MNDDNSFKSTGGLQRIPKAFKYAMQGIRTAIRYEHAFRQELCTFALMLFISALLKFSLLQFFILLTLFNIVLIVELLNSSIEAAIDRIGTERHELSGRAKDLASGAVFLSFWYSVVVWVLMILYNYKVFTRKLRNAPLIL